MALKDTYCIPPVVGGLVRGVGDEVVLQLGHAVLGGAEVGQHQGQRGVHTYAICHGYICA
jgi:hypothetical protein